MLQHPKRKKKSYWETKKRALPQAHLGGMSAKLEGYQTITGNIQRQISTYSESRAVRKETASAWLEAQKKSMREWDVCLLHVFITHIVPTISSQDFLQGKLGMWLNCINILRSFRLKKEKASTSKRNKLLFLLWFSNSARIIEDMWAWTAQVPVFKWKLPTMKQRRRIFVKLLRSWSWCMWHKAKTLLLCNTISGNDTWSEIYNQHLCSKLCCNFTGSCYNDDGGGTHPLQPSPIIKQSSTHMLHSSLTTASIRLVTGLLTIYLVFSL